MLGTDEASNIIFDKHLVGADCHQRITVVKFANLYLLIEIFRMREARKAAGLAEILEADGHLERKRPDRAFVDGLCNGCHV